MALPWVKYVSVLASALKAVAFWGVGTEEKLWGKKISACDALFIQQVKRRYQDSVVAS